MFGSYLQGFIGKIIAAMGFLICLPDGCLISLGDPEGSYIIFMIGVLIMFGGGYMNYLAQQTDWLDDDLTASDSEEENHLGQIDAVYTGERDIDDANYQLYLVEKYKIGKNDTLGVFTMSGKTYKSLHDALKEANQKDSKIPS